MSAYLQAVGVNGTSLDGVPAGYQDMADRKALKILIRP
jgi:hypothetical protein